MIKAILFDLDGTLYDPYLYFSSAFKEIANYLCDKINKTNDEIELDLWALLKAKKSTYPLLYDDLLKKYGIDNKNLVKKLIDIFYKSPTGNLRLYSDAEWLVEQVRDKYRLGIITKGSKKKQSRVIQALRLDKLMEIIIYAEDEGYPKSDPRLFNLALLKLNLKPEDCIYIGDNPFMDFSGANKLGITTVRLLRGEFKECEATFDAKIKVKNFQEILNLID